MRIFDKKVRITDNIEVGGGKMVLFSGPCAIESYDVCAKVADTLKETCDRLDINYIFKASFDKAGEVKPIVTP